MMSTFWKWIEQSEENFLVWMNSFVLHLTEGLEKKHKEKWSLKENDEMKTGVTLYTDGCLVTVERTTEKILQYLHYMLPSNHPLQLCTLSRRHMCRDNNEKRNSLQHAITETDSQNNYRQSSLIFLRSKLQ